MIKEKENQLDPIKKWIEEAGTESLGSEFHLSVLKKIEALPQFSSEYEPVISALGWKLIIIFISVIVGGSFVFVPASKEAPSLLDKLPALNFNAFNYGLLKFNFPSIELSGPFLICIVAFFILGFLMIIRTLRNKQAGI